MVEEKMTCGRRDVKGSGRAARLIECDCHVSLVSKAGSVISSKCPSTAFKWSTIYYTEP